MKQDQNESVPRQWHPAFYAGIQVELRNEAEKLQFQNEYQLGTKPKEIDVLVVKKNAGETIHKNIGRIFKTYNLVEYKSPTDNLGINDFYRVYGYACFYKADTGDNESIPITELTITFVCPHYPRKLIKHLETVRRYKILKTDDGIYYIMGDVIPMQLIITSRLSPDKNLWLSSLTNRLQKTETARRLLGEYNQHKGDRLYESAIDMIVRANHETFKEVEDVCEALEELFQDKIEKLVDERALVLAEEKVKVLAEEKAKVIAEERAVRKKGIKAIIELCHEFGLSQEETCSKLKLKFELSDMIADGCMAEFW